MVRTPGDAARLFEMVAGIDPGDPATEDVPLGDVQDQLRRGLDGLLVGICPDLHLVPLARDVRIVLDAAVRTLEDAGARLVELPFVEAQLIYPAFGVIQRAEALDALGIPVGVQFTGPPWTEARVLRAAQGLFDATPDVQARRPNLA